MKEKHKNKNKNKTKTKAQNKTNDKKETRKPQKKYYLIQSVLQPKRNKRTKQK